MGIVSLFGQAPGYEYQTYDYNSGATLSNEAAAGVSLILVLFMIVIIAVTYVVVALSLSRIFKKAGVETWKAWVPIYNNWVTLELGGQKGYWAVLALIPIVNIAAAVFFIIAMYNIGLKLGKEGAFVLLAIFLPLVWYIWLAVDKSTWKGAVPAAATAKSAGTPTAPTNTAPPAA